MLLCENISAKKLAYKKWTIEIALKGFLLVFIFKFYNWLSRLSSKKVENIIQYDFRNEARKKI